VHVPTPDAEDARQLSREYATVTVDRTRLRNRIQGLLATQGLTLEVTARCAPALATARTGDGRPFPPALAERILHEWAQLATVEARLEALRTTRAAQIAQATTRVTEIARRLTQLRAIGPTSGLLFSAELLGTRTFRNPRALGALSGLVPVPYRSDQRVQDQGISKAGRAELRRVAIQVAWLWVRWQPGSALTQWFARRFHAAGGRARRIGIVALARKLLIALWRFVEHGVIPEGAELKSTT
jgi:transposase